MDVTRGGLKPATITNTINNDVVKFMFNPYEFTLTKANKWTEDPKVGRNVPKVEFDSGGAVTLKLTLHFDTQDTGADVRAFTDPLWKMMMVADETMNDTTNKSQPPPVEFKYNAIYFKSDHHQLVAEVHPVQREGGAVALFGGYFTQAIR